ncbi:MAG TPA: hypothetical protein VJX23_10895 [Candidatus Binataceae bacterium]|nr:hypothetical protein [Candidatus Binataceae bacterium]
MVSAGAERMHWRLITVADDFARFNAEPSVLVATCFPLMIREITDKQVEAWLAELITAGVARTYTVSGTRYGYFVNWAKYQQTRAQKSKFPEPPASDSGCNHLRADVAEKNATRSDSNTEKTDTISNIDHPDLETAPTFERFYLAYPRHKAREAAEKAWNKLAPAQRIRVLADIERRKATEWAGKDPHYLPFPASYLNGKRWTDEIELPVVAVASKPGPNLTPGRARLVTRIETLQRTENAGIRSDQNSPEGQHNLDAPDHRRCGTG